MPASHCVLAAPLLRVGNGVTRTLACALLWSSVVCSVVWSAPAMGQPSGPIIAPDTRFPYHPGIDVARYDFRITLPDAGREIRGQADIVLQRQRSTDTLRLDLREMTVDGVSVRGVARPYRRDSTQLVIPLRPADGAHLTVTIRWHGVPSDGLIITEPTATADDRGWRAFGDNWPNRARYWLPTVDHPSDKAAVRWTISAPAALQVVANGVQTMRRTTKGRSTWQFYLRQPIPTYLMVLGAAQMTQTTLGRTACGHGIGGGCVPQSVWTFPQEASYVPGPFAEADRIVRFFSSTATAFPYERLAHLQSSTRFGGMENATAIFYSDNAFRNRNVGIGLIAHETAHQWFGNAVTPRRWADVWLSEGFATYWSALYLKASRGDSAYHAELQRMRGRILTAKEVAERPVVDSIGAEQPLTLLNRNSYEKGGFFLRLLHAAMGDSAFFGAARDYQRRYRHGTATTGDWQRIAERHAGRSLAPLFQQWLHRPGFADLTVTWATDSATQTLVLQVAQGPRFPPYDLTLAVVVTNRAGQSLTTDIHVAAEATQIIRLPLGALGTPARVELDPDVRLLGRVQLTPAP